MHTSVQALLRLRGVQPRAAAAHAPELRQRLLALGAEPVGNTPAQFAELIKADTASWAALVKSTGTKLD